MVGTIQCDNLDVIKKLLLSKQELPHRKHLKKAASAAAGSQVDLPRVEQELGIATTSKQGRRENRSSTQGSNVCDTTTLPNMSVMTREQKSNAPSVNQDRPQLLLTGITDKVTTQANLENKSLPGTTTCVLPGTTLPKYANPDYSVSIPSTSSSSQVREHNPRNRSVSIVQLTTEVIRKYTKAPVVKPEATVSRDLPSRKCTNQRPVSKRKISGHPQGNKHIFHVKHHILHKRIRKLYLKCRIVNCKQAYRSFHNVQALNVHHHIFHPRVLFRCRICPKIHRTPSSDTYHKYEHQQPTFSCPKCDKLFVFNSKLQQHRRVHIKQRLYKCFYGGCTKSYKYPQDLVRHANSHLSKKFECPLCDYSSDQKCLLKRHSAIHQRIPRYQCKKCRSGFIHYNQLYRHRQKCQYP